MEIHAWYATCQTLQNIKRGWCWISSLRLSSYDRRHNTLINQLWNEIYTCSFVWCEYRKDQVECWDDFCSQKRCQIFKGVVACQNKWNYRSDMHNLGHVYDTDYNRFCYLICSLCPPFLSSFLCKQGRSWAFVSVWICFLVSIVQKQYYIYSYESW